MTLDVNAAVALCNGFAHLVQQLCEGWLQVGAAGAERSLLGQANDHPCPVAFHLGLTGGNFFGQSLADALQFGVGVGWSTRAAGVALAAGSTAAVVSYFHRRLGGGLQIGHLGKELNLTLGHRAGLFCSSAGGRTGGVAVFAGACLRRTSTGGSGLLVAAAAVAAFLLAVGSRGATGEGSHHFDHNLVVLNLHLHFTAVDLLGQLLFGFFKRFSGRRRDVDFGFNDFFAVVGGLLANGVEWGGLCHGRRKMLGDQAVGLGGFDHGDETLHTKGVFE